MSFAPDLGPAIRTALLNSAAISSALADFEDSKSIHTRTPPPAEAEYMMIIISADVSHIDTDGLTNFRSVITKDITIYGQQPNDYRKVEEIGREIRKLFHRNRKSIVGDDFHVVSVTATGPVTASTEMMASSQPSIVGRVVPVTFTVQPKP